MHKTFRHAPLAAAVALLLCGFSTAGLAAGDTSATDLGASNPNQTVSVTLVLGLHHQNALERFIYNTVTPGNPAFHHFLSTAQFAQRYGASAREIAAVQAFIKRQGLQQEQLLPNHLAIKVSGTIAQFDTAFHTSIHDYRASDGSTYHQPSTTPTLPAALAGTLVVASGLSSEARYHSHRLKAILPPQPGVHALARGAAPAATCTGNPTATCSPGEFTVGDVANRYNINPLYHRGISGKGSTIGIATLANFLPADAYAYWNAIGLAVKPDRITQVHVDGGGPLGAAAGSGETSLDVEQSGGLAPQADIIVYDAPNTDAGFFDVFNQAVSDNQVDSLSVSWGSPEIYYFSQTNNGVDHTDQLRAFHQVFLEAAAQGISLFAAAGDSGAYDTVRSLGGLPTDPVPPPLSVDAPGSDPFITSAGGTTVPFTYSFSGGPTATLSKESVWGWDYIADYFETNLGVDLTPVVYSVGGGGGVSVFWRQPLYQRFTYGMRRSEKHQTLLAPAYGIDYTLPGNFRGRNEPDVSLNADPETGYIVVSTEDGGVIDGYGGTSFVAPQLNGISALLTQSTGHRIGFWNPQMYFLQNIFGYGPWSAFNSVNAGDNWHYAGAHHYTPGAGIGTLDVDNLNLFLGGR